MDLELSQLFYLCRVVFLFGIAVMVGVVYKAPKDPNSFDLRASFYATLLAGVSFAWGTANLITWTPVAASVREFLATMFVGLVFALTIYARGNVAKMFRRRATT